MNEIYIVCQICDEMIGSREGIVIQDQNCYCLDCFRDSEKEDEEDTENE